MKQYLVLLVAAVVVLLGSCASGPTGSGTPEGGAKSAEGLEEQYRAKLAEIQVLNVEMARANDALDFGTVNAKGKEALARAAEARAIAEQVRDPETKAKLLADVGKITTDLQYVVKITGS